MTNDRAGGRPEDPGADAPSTGPSASGASSSGPSASGASSAAPASGAASSGAPVSGADADLTDDLDPRLDDRARPFDSTGVPGRAGSSRPGTSSLAARWGSKGVTIVLALTTVAVLLVGFLVGFAVRGATNNEGPSALLAAPASSSVDAGFARDMIVHHQQGVTMANYAEENTDDPDVRRIAYDISATQLAQIGQMQGWLALWQLPPQVSGPRMAWMQGGGHDMAAMNGAAAPTTGGSAAAGAGAATGTADDSGHMALMPGMATSGEMDRLKSLRGKESDIYFLQLMIRHHQGGQAMMQYAQDNAGNPIVANFAGKMLQSQTAEVTVMTQMLAERGAKPLPFNG
ncbi:DUF305 domain-containing protein [Nakamurella aerolata]|uniref:DUF305 domain-containing protein n=1 Tax=Nakamurella aerolata TaxID=1656892 RepID=A0A849ACM0_9ACTN|nr:DUF305 domain-containing protein [Nakamurella aerolata]NNG37473.1 DUF305 domain-containing protein [Nakamurella aerolata]